jgi:hypothetical protein
MKVIADSVDHYCVTRVVSTGASGTDIDLVAENVDKLPFALIAPLTAKNNSCHGATVSKMSRNESWCL